MIIKRRILDYGLSAVLLVIPVLILHSNLKNPEKLNAFRMQTYEEVIDALKLAGWDREVGVIVKRVKPQDADLADQLRRAWTSVQNQVSELRQPMAPSMGEVFKQGFMNASMLQLAVCAPGRRAQTTSRAEVLIARIGAKAAAVSA